MKSRLLFLLLITGFSRAGTLRISEVREKAGDETERMILRYERNGQAKEEELFVLREAVIGDGDVAQAWVEPGHVIGVKLNPDGAKAMAEATKEMLHGRERLAVIVDGKLVSAPVVQSTLGGSFQIQGLTELDDRGLDDLARRMSGRPKLGPDENPPPVPAPSPRFETVPFTEEEYQENKAAREKMGLFFLDSVPSEEELNAKLEDGTSVADVVAVFGKPSHSSGKPDQGEFRLVYSIAPEKRPGNPGREMPADGFHVQFTDGAKIRWSFTYSNLPREQKVVGREPGLLVASYPQIDLSGGEIDLVALLEGVKIPDVRQKVNATDLTGLLLLATMSASSGSKDMTLNPTCDLMKILAIHFPEAKSLKEDAVTERINLHALADALTPYYTGTKALPEVTVGDSEGETE